MDVCNKSWWVESAGTYWITLYVNGDIYLHILEYKQMIQSYVDIFLLD